MDQNAEKRGKMTGKWSLKTRAREEEYYFKRVSFLQKSALFVKNADLCIFDKKCIFC